MSIDRDALIEAKTVQEKISAELHRQVLIEAAHLGLRQGCQADHCLDVVHQADAIRAVDAILPAVEQAIRAAEQHGRDEMAREVTDWLAVGGTALVASRLARGGTTDEEQTP